MLAGCTDDTLYDGDDVTGPEVTVAPHTVSVRLATTPPRVEVGEAMRVVVTARGTTEEPGRIAQLGGTVLVMNTARTDTVAVQLGPEAVSPPASGAVSREFEFTIRPEWVDRLRLPDTLALEVHGWAVNVAGACAAAVQDSVQKLPCADYRGGRVASGRTGLRARVAVAAGTTVALPAGAGAIGDLVVDRFLDRVYLSNRAAHRIEVLDPLAGRFTSPIRVGSEPWGLGTTLEGDTLIVANSGGVNISFVPLRNATLAEDVGKRFQIPRARLYDFRIEVTVDSVTQDTVRSFRLDYHTYADRPQYVAQDARRRLLYSAISTQAAPVGTIRLAEWQDGWSTWDARLLFAQGLLAGGMPSTHRAIRASNPEDVAIANVDSVSLEFIRVGPLAGPTGRITIYDHRPGTRPGDPGRLIQNPVPLNPVDAVFDMANRGSDVIAYPAHRWNVPQTVAMADTTFVAVSGDHRYVAFGESSDEMAGRVVLWGAADTGNGSLSRVDDISDIVNNTSDRITGIDLNQDGSLGVARGSEATYFFANDLTLRGLTRTAQPGGAGASLRRGMTSGGNLAFVGSGRNSILVVETTHYTVLGEVPVRDNIVGPLRAAPPLPGQPACPADFTQAAGECVLARVYGVTSGGGVVMVDVLGENINPAAAAGRRK
ncbi:MAG TPA: hypothetical protein VHG51_18595 [Longimicrobiaceae bacterium]|nr:hypothetical protein [Longimicrobiaceae bacterium]